MANREMAAQKDRKQDMKAERIEGIADLHN
jgi:hypothetical protein